VVVHQAIVKDPHLAEPLIAPHVLKKKLLFVGTEYVPPVNNPGDTVVDGVSHRIRGVKAWERHIRTMFRKTYLSSRRNEPLLDRYAVGALAK